MLASNIIRIIISSAPLFVIGIWLYYCITNIEALF